MAERASEQSIFLHAIGLATPAERSAYLDEACVGDRGLRADLDALLAAHAKLGGSRGGVASGADTAESQAPTATRCAEAAGEVLGSRYRLVHQIGEGGMGAVWMAEQQEPVRRLVAVKLIKAGMDSKAVLARFEQERQALALMDHPNIAKVLDAGATDAGRHYFVMELVQGVPITTFCDERRLTIRQRLELFLPVCQAIQHAHQKGVLHRDVKPSNVLVALYDQHPVPKVIDFGVAKATAQPLTEQSWSTGFGAVVGTLEYMSPEQADFDRPDVDTRADVYSLGVLLYELLAGGPPFRRQDLRQAGLLEALRRIREQDPPRPAARLSAAEDLAALAANRGADPARLVALVRGELNWVVMKALEKDRGRRYESASALARDVERHLADEPVLAHPPSLRYRFGKFARRNKAALGSAALVASALLTGAGVATWQAVVATGAKQEALASAAEEKAAKETAQRREAETTAVLNYVENRILAAARPKGQEGGLGREVTLAKAIEAAVPFVEKGFPEEPLIEARLRMTLGTSFRYLGDPKSALEQYQKARVLYSKHLGPDHLDTLRSLNHVAVMYDTLGRFPESLPLRLEVFAGRKAQLGPDHVDTIASMINLANSYAALSRHDEALSLREETLELAKAHLGPRHPDTLLCMSNLAISYDAVGQRDRYLQLCQETLALREVHAQIGPDHPDTLASMNNLAVAYNAHGRHQEALDLREHVLKRREDLLGGDHHDTLLARLNVAFSYAALGRHSKALECREEALRLTRARFDPDHPLTLTCRHDLALSYSALGRHQDALREREETLRLRKAKLGADNPATLLTMHDLADTFADLGRHDDALKHHEEALALRRAKLAPNHPNTLKSIRGVAASLIQVNRGAEAVPLLDECLRRAAGKVVPATLIPDVMNLRLRHFEKAKDAAGCRATAEMWEKLGRVEAGSLYTAAQMRAVTAAVARGAGRGDEADAESDRAMAWLRKAVAAGYKDSAGMAKDKDLAGLRGREDFKQLLAGPSAR